MKSVKPTSLMLLFSSLIFFLTSCESTAQLTKILEQATGNPSTSEISAGIKEALEKGTGISADRLSAEDGFLENLDVKILFPEEAKKVENTLRNIGLGKLCDDVILSLNRAAEDASKEAKPIFTAAIKQMTLQDVQDILLGEKNAATQYFERTTTDSLTVKFAPIIDQSLTRVNATKYWGEVIERYNQVPFVKKVDTDLGSYVTQKAIDGLFVEIAKEELKIRENISARTSPLLQKVFGYAERQRKYD
ncbi:DUF4197 domain-containing protein [Algoriphagus sp.]|uniref:DUF4197 domain-containing protein n=1 Tax=Algoriphagus sp. TaxID=1872435 RepID=UPI00262A6E50|nr:DUF4197 domain-containing protein [Algoriphagus sp.]